METDAPETFRGIFMHPLPLLNGKTIYKVANAEQSFPTGRSYFDIPIEIPAGYRCVGLSVTHIRADWIQCSLTLKNNNAVNVVAYNYFTSAITSDIEITATCEKTNL